MTPIPPIFAIFLSFLAILATAEPEPPLPAALDGKDERCITLMSTKNAAFKEPEVREAIQKQFCTDPTEPADPNGWCAVALPPKPPAPPRGVAPTDEDAYQVYFRWGGEQTFWMAVYVPECAGKLDVMQKFPSIVHQMVGVNAEKIK